MNENRQDDEIRLPPHKSPDECMAELANICRKEIGRQQIPPEQLYVICSGERRGDDEIAVELNGINRSSFYVNLSLMFGTSVMAKISPEPPKNGYFRIAWILDGKLIVKDFPADLSVS